MKFPFSFRLFGSAPEDTEATFPVPVAAMDEGLPGAALLFPFIDTGLPGAADSLGQIAHGDGPGDYQSTLFRTLGWISAGVGALVLGLVVGRELRVRYKFNRRTPYDFYAHAGDERDLEFGVGI